MGQIQEMVAAGRKCAAEYSHRACGGQVYDDLPASCLDKSGKPNTRKAKELTAAWWVGFHGGTIPPGSRLQISEYSTGRISVKAFDKKSGSLVADCNI